MSLTPAMPVAMRTRVRGTLRRVVWSAPLVLALVGAALALVASVQTKHACAILATVCAAIVVFLLWTGA